MQSIRKYEKSDYDDVVRIATQVVDRGTEFPFENVDGVLQYWLAENCEVFVYERNGQVVGTYTIKPNCPDRCSHVANAGYMVHELFQGQKIGLELAQHSLSIARQLGYRSMQFNLVVATNASAIRLWKKLGFEIIGRSPAAFRLDSGQFVDLLIMQKTL